MDTSQIAKLYTHSLKQALLYLYGYQTVEEQATQSTDNLNGVGFNMLDATLLSSFAEQVLKGWELSEKQFNRMRLMLPKYHKQLTAETWRKIQLPGIVRVNG